MSVEAQLHRDAGEMLGWFGWLSRASVGLVWLVKQGKCWAGLVG